ncbi:MAG: hypothetical protein H0V01_00635 [Bacteroidetes bacterium]|nr:hypothetical protein [Bacteroidota bacterium]HET6245617.1 hypothetical protein [Bacteroidia bacterium]
MICLSGNKTTYSLLEKKSCFPIDEDEKKTDSDTFDARCCDFVSGYVHVDLLSFEDPLKLKVSQILIVFGFAKQFPFELINPVLTQGYTETPPLAYGITLLKFIGIFRI